MVFIKHLFIFSCFIVTWVATIQAFFTHDDIPIGNAVGQVTSGVLEKESLLYDVQQMLASDQAISAMQDRLRLETLTAQIVSIHNIKHTCF